MGKKESDFLSKLRAIFKTEAAEHLKTMSSCLLELEKAPTTIDQKAIVETLFRETHSLKGAARAADITEIEKICQSLESAFSAFKHHELSLTPAVFNTTHQALDTLGKLLISLEGSKGGALDEKQVSEPLPELSRLEAGPRDKSVWPQAKTPRAPEGILVETRLTPSETVRISTKKLFSLLLQAEEMISFKLKAGQRVTALRDMRGLLDLREKQREKIAPQIQTMRRLLDGKEKRPDKGQIHLQFSRLLELIDGGRTFVKALKDQLAALEESAEQEHRSLGRAVDTLLENFKKTLMFPFSTLLEVFPKMVRDLAHDQGKEAELVLEGGGVEVDRRILEEMRVPLNHLLRNCIDHGLEKPEQRERSKKPRRGKIRVAVSRAEGDKVEILIADDGAGIDVEKVKKAALTRGIITEADAGKLGRNEVLSLIFQSEVSTSPLITEISGRGLGLAIVQEKVEKLGGLIAVESTLQQGTLFRILLPAILAAFRGILVRVAGQLFIIPIRYVEQVIRIKQEEIKTVENKETILRNGCPEALVRMADVLDLPLRETALENSGFITVLVLGLAEERIAFSVDRIFEEQEVLVKRLGRQLSRVRNIGGAAVLGSGKVVPILDVPDVMKSAVKTTRVPARSAIAVAAAEAEKKSILVVEDSITTRMLLKNILESAGYQVKTAVDGVDAFNALREEDFDLVVSDIDMPKMDGFALTSQIRRDQKLAEVPVVLVTALESPEDRKRGLDAGANAYIVKRSFDQSNLLEVIQRLI